MRVPAFFSEYQRLADEELQRLTPDRGDAVQRSMAYTVLAPSKRVRGHYALPVLVDTINISQSFAVFGEMTRIFGEASKAIEQTTRFLKRCKFLLDELKPNYPSEFRHGYATAQCGV